MSATTATTYRIPAHNIGILERKLAAIAKRANRLGLDAPVYHVVATEYDKVPARDARGDVIYDLQGTVYDTIEISVITVTGGAPLISGYEFVAVLEHDEDGNILRTVPGANVTDGELADFRTAAPYCDHCGTNRRRNDTYLLRTESGIIKQVGSSCLKDFIPTDNNDPNAVARYAEAFIAFIDSLSDSDSEYHGGGGERLVEMFDYLCWVAVAIREYGWVSRSKAGFDTGQATADTAHYMRIDSRTDKTVPTPTEADEKIVTDALAWIRERDMQGNDSDYIWNLYHVCQKDYIAYRRMGIAASLVSTYQRTIQRDMERKVKAENSKHIGTVKERLTIEVTVTGTTYIEGYYGTTSLVKFVTDTGDIVKWFASNDPRLDTGERIALTGTVKDHGEWQGVAETTLTRCKVAGL